MSEETQGSEALLEAEIPVEQPEATPEEKKPAVPSFDDRAKKFGHVDYETWCTQGKTPEEWVDPETYVKNFTWVREINKLKDTIDKQKKSMEFLVEHNKKVEELGRQKALEELNKKIEDAVVLGDTKTVTQLNDELVKLKISEQKVQQQPQFQSEPDYLTDFKSRNSRWFNNTHDAVTSAMTAYAFRKDAEIQAKNPGIDPRVALRMIEDDIKNVFPSYFTTKEETPKMENKSPAVESGGAVNTPKNNKATLKDLPSEARTLAETLKRTTRNFNEDLFIKQYKQINGA